jgi:Holliday junction resolvase RusA-like endonuclease
MEKIANMGTNGLPESTANQIRLDIKPLSVNLAWKGQRFRTTAYKTYQIQVRQLLPAIQLPEPPYKLSFVFGFSNSASDLDNPVKCVQDIIATHYGFNDKLIVELNIKKELVKKGNEFIEFELLTAA